MSEFGKSRMKLGGAVVALVALAVAANGIATRVHGEQQLADWTAKQVVPTVALIHPTPAAAAGALTLPATLQPLNSAPIYARTSGYIRQWSVDIGDTVKKGQLLAVLDAPEVEQQLATATAQLETARANQELAKSTATRWSNMLTKDAVSKQETDEKLGDLAAKTATTNAARADVERLKALTDYTRILAPFDGQVTSRSTQIGALVTAGNASATPLFTIDDVSRIRAFVRVPQLYSGQIRQGMEVGLTLPEYPGRSFKATLVRSAGAVDPASGSLLVELQADNPDRALKPGAYAQAGFPVERAEHTVTLPPSALMINDKGTQVALFDGAGKAVLRPVTLGRDLGKAVEITAGLSADESVINNPPDSLQNGDLVQPAAKEEQANGAK